MDEIDNLTVEENNHIEIGKKVGPKVTEVTKMKKRGLITRTVIVTIGVAAIVTGILLFIFVR